MDFKPGQYVTTCTPTFVYKSSMIPLGTIQDRLNSGVVLNVIHVVRRQAGTNSIILGQLDAHYNYRWVKIMNLTRGDQWAEPFNLYDFNLNKQHRFQYQRIRHRLIQSETDDKIENVIVKENEKNNDVRNVTVSPPTVNDEYSKKQTSMQNTNDNLPKENEDINANPDSKMREKLTNHYHQNQTKETFNRANLDQKEDIQEEDKEKFSKNNSPVTPSYKPNLHENAQNQNTNNEISSKNKTEQKSKKQYKKNDKFSKGSEETKFSKNENLDSKTFKENQHKITNKPRINQPKKVFDHSPVNKQEPNNLSIDPTQTPRPQEKVPNQNINNQGFQTGPSTHLIEYQFQLNEKVAFRYDGKMWRGIVTKLHPLKVKREQDWFSFIPDSIFKLRDESIKIKVHDIVLIHNVKFDHWKKYNGIEAKVISINDTSKKYKVRVNGTEQILNLQQKNVTAVDCEQEFELNYSNSDNNFCDYVFDLLQTYTVYYLLVSIGFVLCCFIISHGYTIYVFQRADDAYINFKSHQKDPVAAEKFIKYFENDKEKSELFKTAQECKKIYSEFQSNQLNVDAAKKFIKYFKNDEKTSELFKTAQKCKKIYDTLKNNPDNYDANEEFIEYFNGKISNDELLSQALNLKRTIITNFKNDQTDVDAARKFFEYFKNIDLNNDEVKKLFISSKSYLYKLATEDFKYFNTKNSKLSMTEIESLKNALEAMEFIFKENFKQINVNITEKLVKKISFDTNHAKNDRELENYFVEIQAIYESILKNSVIDEKLIKKTITKMNEMPALLTTFFKAKLDEWENNQITRYPLRGDSPEIGGNIYKFSTLPNVIFKEVTATKESNNIKQITQNRVLFNMITNIYNPKLFAQTYGYFEHNGKYYIVMETYEASVYNIPEPKADKMHRPLMKFMKEVDDTLKKLNIKHAFKAQQVFFKQAEKPYSFGVVDFKGATFDIEKKD